MERVAQNHEYDATEFGAGLGCPHAGVAGRGPQCAAQSVVDPGGDRLGLGGSTTSRRKRRDRVPLLLDLGREV